MSTANRATLLIETAEPSRLAAAMSVALSAAAIGMQVTVFFTFGGLTALRRRETSDQVAQCVANAVEMGVRLIACETTLPTMGLTRDDLVAGLEYGGVASYLADAVDSRITLAF